jgi:hypothetical protein
MSTLSLPVVFLRNQLMVNIEDLLCGREEKCFCLLFWNFVFDNDINVKGIY